MSFSEIFSEILEPSSDGVPFVDKSWIGIAFDRNDYDNTRMPEWFFRCASEQFAMSNDVQLLVAGDCFVQTGHPELYTVPFSWKAYKKFMLLSDHYCTEYRIASSDKSCVCLTDPDITIFGGAKAPMTMLIKRMGGVEEVLNSMRKEFFLGDTEPYRAMDHYLQCLLRPELR